MRQYNAIKLSDWEIFKKNNKKKMITPEILKAGEHETPGKNFTKQITSTNLWTEICTKI